MQTTETVQIVVILLAGDILLMHATTALTGVVDKVMDTLTAGDTLLLMVNVALLILGVDSL
jgi:hypothetical protein